MKKILLAFILVLSNLLLFAQDTLTVQRIIEDVIEQVGEESDFDFNTLFEHLETYYNNPINLNSATQEDLFEFGLLTPAQINALVNYREAIGELSAFEELQAVPLFDIRTIENIKYFVTISGEVTDVQSSFGDLLTRGNHEFVIRTRTILEEQAGFVSENGEPSSFTGNPYQIYSRYRYSFDTRASYGVTMEKDMGEGFLDSFNVYGFDFYSAHFYIHDWNKRVKDVAIGDYELRFGQGLVMWSGFGFGKSSFVTNTKRIGRRVKSYTSVNETNFLRGSAATIGLTDKIDLTAFASYKNRDGNITEIDNTTAEIAAVSSLQNTGLHRTLSEIEDENAIQEFTTGGSLKFQPSLQSHIAANVVYTSLSAPVNLRDRPSNVFRFSDSLLVNGSLDYSHIYKNINLFGETAISDNRGWATTNGVLITLEQFIDLAILQRYYSPDFHTLYTNTFSETTGTNNEQGIYLGIQIKPNKAWQYSFYFDTWKHPWLRSQTDAPAHGHEYFGQITYQPRKSTQVYLRVRNKIRMQNYRDEAAKTNYLVQNKRIDTRLHFQTKVSESLEFRTRISLSFFDDSELWTNGFLLFQDVIYKPKDFPVSFSARYALFDTDNFDTRIYAFENDLLYSFSVPAFYERGSRAYINLRYKGIRNLTIEGRFARTRLTNQETIGSGLNEINRNTRTEVKLQMRYKF